MNHFSSFISHVLFLLILLSTPSCRKTPCDCDYEQSEELILKETNCLRTEVIEQNLEDLFRIQGLLLNESIVALLNDECDNFEMIRFNLQVNIKEIANFFTEIYTSDIGCRFEQLLLKQIQLHFDYVQAVKTYDKAQAHCIALKQRLHGDIIIEFLHINNPFFASHVEGPVLEEHLSLLMEQTVAYFRQDMKAVEDLRIRLVDQLAEWARHLIRAIDKQLDDEC